MKLFGTTVILLTRDQTKPQQMILLQIISPWNLISSSPFSTITDNGKDKFSLVSRLAKFSIFSCDFAVNLLGELPVNCHLFPVLSQRVVRRSEASTKEKLVCEFHFWHLSNCRTSLQEQKLASCCQQGWKDEIGLVLSGSSSVNAASHLTHVSLWLLQPRWIPASPLRTVWKQLATEST